MANINGLHCLHKHACCSRAYLKGASSEPGHSPAEEEHHAEELLQSEGEHLELGGLPHQREVVQQLSGFLSENEVPGAAVVLWFGCSRQPSSGTRRHW